MSKILALDTSSEACSCALNIDGQLEESFALIPRLHARSILPMIHELLALHSLELKDLDAISVGRGPGSFTGLRIAVGVAQGLAFASNLPVIPVSTLEALAWHAFNSHKKQNNKVLACIDARINEVYWAFFNFNNGVPELIGSECINLPEDIPSGLIANSGNCIGVGNGFLYIDKMDKKIKTSLETLNANCYPRAIDIAALASMYFERGQVQTAESVAPIYLRDKVTHG